MSNVRPNAVCIVRLRSILQAFSRLAFDTRASSRVHNPKGGPVTKWCDLGEMKRAKLCDLRAEDPRVANQTGTPTLVSRASEPSGVRAPACFRKDLHSLGNLSVARRAPNGR